jgi:hypothetical protein
MLRRVPLLSFAAALACAALVAAAEAQQDLSCLAGTVSIQAVTDADGAFPVPVPCPTPNTLGVTSCLKWEYVYQSDSTISVSAISLDSDVDLVAASGGSGGSVQFLPGGGKVYDAGSTDSSIGIGGGVYNMRTVKFAAIGNTVHGTLYTRTNVGVGTVSAVAKVGNAGPISCAIAGADNVEGISVGLAPVTTKAKDQFGPCTIDLTLDSKGCPSDISVSPGPPACNIKKNVALLLKDEDIPGDPKPFLGGVCGNRFTSEGSKCTWYCPTSSGSCFQVCYP